MLVLPSCAAPPAPNAAPPPAPVSARVDAPPAGPAPAPPAPEPPDTGARVAVAQGMTCFRSGGHVDCRVRSFGAPLKGDKTTSLDDVREIAAGEVHACAIKRSGDLVCWGLNDDGELGDGTTEGRWEPRKVPDVPAAVKVAVGNRMMCALFADDSLRCWGGMGKTPPLARPQPVALKGKVRSLSAGFFQACAALDDGKVVCFGPSGQVVKEVSGVTEAVEVAVGSHACARRRDGSVWCWGNNGNGQLGRPQGDDENVPRAVAGLARATQIAAGPYHSCALLEDATVSCWGSLGGGEHVPTRMPGLENVAEIGAGYDGVCAVTRDGKDVCNAGQ